MKKLFILPLLILSSFTLQAAPTFTKEQRLMSKQSVMDIVISNPDFTTFVATAHAADLITFLQSPGPLTVFAPTNSAFARLPEGTVENWLKPENRETLKNVLLYHILHGRIVASDIRTGKSATANGKTVDFKVLGNEIYMNHAKVVKTDMNGSNGVVHAVDAVLIP